MEEKEKIVEKEIIVERKDRKTLIIILSVVFTLILCGVIVYFSFYYNKDNISETNNTNKNNNYTEIDEINSSRNVNDYITVSDTEEVKIIYEGACEEGYFEFNKLKEVAFKNLPAIATWEFEVKNLNFTNRLNDRVDGTTSELENSIIYDIYGDIFSVYTEEKDGIPCFHLGDFEIYSLNIDLKNNRVITNEEMLAIFNIDIEDVYTMILNDIISIQEEWLPGAGALTELYSDRTEMFLDADEDLINFNEFKNNIDTYVEYINNRYDKFSLYIYNDHLFVAYNMLEILPLVGWHSVYPATEAEIIQLN